MSITPENKNLWAFALFSRDAESLYKKKWVKKRDSLKSVHFHKDSSPENYGEFFEFLPYKLPLIFDMKLTSHASTDLICNPSL